MLLKRNKQRNRATQLQQNPVFFGSIAILPSHTQKLILSTTEQKSRQIQSYAPTLKLLFIMHLNFFHLNC